MIYRDGEWHGTKFVYREPKMAFHAYLSPATNNKVFAFRFPDAPPFAYIGYKFQIDAPSNFLSLIVTAHPNQWPNFKGPDEWHYTKGGLSVNKRRDMYLKAFVRPDALPFSVRVYVTDWMAEAETENEYQRAEHEPARWG